jgi:hypothetical protein
MCAQLLPAAFGFQHITAVHVHCSCYQPPLDFNHSRLLERRLWSERNGTWKGTATRNGFNWSLSVLNNWMVRTGA